MACSYKMVDLPLSQRHSTLAPFTCVVSEMTYYVSSGPLNATHSLTFSYLSSSCLVHFQINPTNLDSYLYLYLRQGRVGLGHKKWTHEQLWEYDIKTCCTTLRWLLTAGFSPGVFVSETLPVSYVIFPFTLTRFNVRNLLQLPMDSCELTEWRRGTQVRVRSNHFALIGDGFRTTMS